VFIRVLPQNSLCSYTPLYGIAAHLPTPYLNHNIHCTTLNPHTHTHTHTLSHSLSSHLPSHTLACRHHTACRHTTTHCTFPPVISRSAHGHSGSMASPALRETMLPGATALCYTAPSSRLLDPSSPQVWRQSVQVDNHHLCFGMSLNPVYDVVDPGDDEVGAFPACL